MRILCTLGTQSLQDPYGREASEILSQPKRFALLVGLAPGAIKVDVPEFDGLIAESRWSDALDLYAGDFFPGFHLENARGFEEWMDGERERLRGKAAGAAWALARDHISRGGLVEAERSAKKALGFVWTEETPVREFIWALAEAGDRIAAIKLFEMFCSRLRRDLDLEPSARTRQVAEQIRKEEVDWVLAS